jgi:hypothetical protein
VNIHNVEDTISLCDRGIVRAMGIETRRRHLRELIDYREAKQATLVNCGSRQRAGEPISTAFVESIVNEIVSRRMIKKHQMHWNRWSV